MRNSLKMASRALLAMAVLSATSTLSFADQSVARQWDETLLAAIRKDTPRPPVHARNLFHVSVAMYDAWAAYDSTAQGYFFTEKLSAVDPTAARNEAVSYAAYRIMRQRFATGPNVALVRSYLDTRMAALGYSVDVTTTVGDSPAAVGNRIAAQLLERSLADGSREQFNYAPEAGTPGPVNPPLIAALPGITMVDPNRWQPLALSFTIGAKGNVIPGSIQSRLAPHWGNVNTFALTAADRDPTLGVYLDAPAPAQINGLGDAAYRAGHEDVLLKSCMLTPDDGVMIDISPAVMGNNTLGTNDGTGRAINPITGSAYASNFVKRGDWSRCLSEFWADGPTSATPPGHWNEIANAVTDHPLFQRRVGGAGAVLDSLEYDVKLYVTLNGAMHDAAVTACSGTAPCSARRQRRKDRRSRLGWYTGRRRQQLHRCEVDPRQPVDALPARQLCDATVRRLHVGSLDLQPHGRRCAHPHDGQRVLPRRSYRVHLHTESVPRLRGWTERDLYLPVGDLLRRCGQLGRVAYLRRHPPGLR